MPESTVTDDRLALEYARLHAECQQTIARLTDERDRALELIAGLIFLGAEREGMP